MTDEHKKWIDESDYEALLIRWRFSAVGDPIFQDDTGEYYKNVMLHKKSQCDHSAVSKRVGLDKP